MVPRLLFMVTCSSRQMATWGAAEPATEGVEEGFREVHKTEELFRKDILSGSPEVMNRW
jgi:hypothetical protein